MENVYFFVKEKTGTCNFFLTLTGKGRKAILELEPDTLPVDSGVENLIEFECLYYTIKNYDMGLPDGVLACILLCNANISEYHKQLVRATLSESIYNALKE